MVLLFMTTMADRHNPTRELTIFMARKHCNVGAD